MCGSGKSVAGYTEGKTLGNYLRANEIKGMKDSYEDIYDVMHAFPKVNYRYYVEPSAALPGGLALLGFNNKTTWPCQQMGRKDGADVVGRGPGVDFNTKIKNMTADVLPSQKLDFLQE